MLKTRQIHRDEQGKDKLYDALRELYRDGVRVYTGQLPAGEVVKRKVDDRLHLRQPSRDAGLKLASEAKKGRNPYDPA